MITLIPDNERRFSGLDEYFVVLKHGCSKSDFVRAAQVVNGSYAGELVERVYDCLITHAVDVLHEHQEYYAIEYPDLKTFLYWKYNVDHDIAGKLVDSLKPGDFLGYGSVYSGGDYVMGQLIVSKSGLEMVNCILGNLEEAAE